MKISNLLVADIKIGTQRRSTGDLGWLCESIRENGLMSPITVTSDGRLISGWHRLEACKLLKHSHIPARVLEADESRVALAAIDENLVRKELSALERAEHLAERKAIFENIHPDTRRGGNRGNQYSGGFKRQTAVSAFCQQAAVWTGHSRRSVSTYVHVSQRLTAQAKEKVKGTVLEDSISLLTALCRLPSELQTPAIEYFLSRKCKTIRQAAEILERQMRREGSADVPLPKNVRLVLGDFREVGDQIDDESVALLLTDPPYDEASLHLFDPLGAFAAKKLIAGGSMFCMIGAYNLPTIMAALHRHLTWQWSYTFILGGAGKIVHQRSVCSAHKLILWFVKGKYTGQPYTDVIDGVGKDKRFHIWGQSENGFDKLVERYSQPGDLILDPFLGGGTTAVVAHKARREFVGIDEQLDSINMTRKRIAEIYKDADRALAANESRMDVPR